MATGWLKIWDTLCGQPLRLDTRRDSHGHNRGLFYLSAQILVAAAAAEMHSDRVLFTRDARKKLFPAVHPRRMSLETRLR